MKIINIQEAKTQLSKLVEQVLQGEDLVIAKAGKPLVRLTPFAPEPAERKLGIFAGQGYWEAPDCWEPDLELEARFMGELPKWSEAEKAAAEAWIAARRVVPLSDQDATKAPLMDRVADESPR